jgi:hypothetical protein
MSTGTTVLNKTNSMFTNYDLTKLLLGFNSFTKGTVTASGAAVELVAGQIMGRIAATQKLVAADKDATDGSQYPVGICLQTQTVADGVSVEITLVNKGNVAEAELSFADVETLATAIGPTNNLKSYRDLLNDLGLVLLTATELTAFDNS